MEVRLEDEFDEKLSGALEILGLSEVSIKRKINKYSKIETRINEEYRDTMGFYSVYISGSRAEGIALSSMTSDTDLMVSSDLVDVFMDMKCWQLSNNVTYLTDSTMVHHGYTRLRPIKPDRPLFLEPSELARVPKYIRDIVVTDGNDCFLSNRICFSSSFWTSYLHGPANTTDFGDVAGVIDTVYCLRCKSWPIEAREWNTRRRLADWPSGEFLRTLENESCFLVPVSSAKSQQPGIEWRYSFSLVERRLIHSWTNKQSKCYVLLKMMKDVILKTIPQCKNTLCSYHLKTIMFWVSESKGTAWWETHSLSHCFMFCLSVLHEHLMAGNCPSYFIPENNLFDSFCGTAELRILVGALDEFLKEGRTCLKRCDLVIDQLAERNHQIASWVGSTAVVQDDETAIVEIFMKSNFDSPTISLTEKSLEPLLYMISYLRMFESVKPSSFGNMCIRAALPIVKSQVGGSAFGFLKSNKLPNRVVHALNSCIKRLLQAGTSADIAMGNLKLANYYFILGEYRKSVNILEDISSRLTPGVITCSLSISHMLNLQERMLDPNNTAIKRAVDRCCRHLPFEQQLRAIHQQTLCWPVIFHFDESHSTPKPITIEMFRRNSCPSTTFGCVEWSNAIVDPFVMTYFLQFTCYKKLGKQNHMLVALSNLKWAALQKSDAEYTPETAINLIGYCYMQLGDLDNALKYFIKSLQVNSLMNVAYIHIAILLAKALRR